jgi:Lon protease-like protein
MSKDDSEPDNNSLVGLAAHEDARALVRLIQCPLCSMPFRTPVTLPCGNTLCRQCVPRLHERENVSYPDIPGRKQAIVCPFADCGQEHPAVDCSVDVTVSKLMDAVSEIVARQLSISGKTTTVVQELVRWDEIVSGDPVREKANIQTLPGGRLVATYSLAAKGELYRANDLLYHSTPSTNEAQHLLDYDILQEILEATHQHVDCQVCYNLLLDPVTTPCGHTLCRICLTRTLDHSIHCPVCRRGLGLPPSLSGHPSNKTLTSLLDALCPQTVASRRQAIAQEETGGEGTLNTPLFVCALGFPNTPTFLRIFEPRYRLMLRRCLEGNREFGMLMYNRYSEPQGDLGSVHFYQYGTMMHINHSQMLADGTSLIECRGAYRFRVLAHGLHDGYCVGKVERLDDVSTAEEERLEALETSTPQHPVSPPTISGIPAHTPESAEALFNRMPTRELLEIGSSFIERMRARSANWLQQRVLDTHGQPPSDPALFPFWFASVLPISDEEKYKLLPTTTVRQRLKITAEWIQRIEGQRW